MKTFSTSNLVVCFAVCFPLQIQLYSFGFCHSGKFVKAYVSYVSKFDNTRSHSANNNELKDTTHFEVSERVLLSTGTMG